MSELTTLIRNYPPERLAADLLADPHFKAFNVLWKSPGQIERVCDYFGLSTVQQAIDFAGRLNGGFGEYADRLASWLNPRPGVDPASLTKAPWAEVQGMVLKGLEGKTHAVFHLEPWDGTLMLPDYADLVSLMAVCPAHRFKWTETVMDCDDQTRIMRGWLSEHGLGTLAIGFGAYRAYRGDVDIGGHMVGLAVTKAGQLWMCEPRDGKVYPMSVTTLGGFLATSIKFQRVIF